MSRSLLLLSLLLLCGLVIACAGGLWEINPDIGHNGDGADEVSEYHPPKDAEKSGLTDDQLADKPVLPFDPTVVDSRPIDKHQLNASAAVIKLDVPLIKPDVDAKLLTLYPSYAAALAAVRGQGDDVLPSVNLLDGKVKQFDDGLYAALDRAYYRGLQDRLHGHVELVRCFYERIGKNGPAAAYLAAGLELAGVHVDAGDKAARDLWLRGFQENEVLCKPIGFYTWNKELATCFRFLRFFQQEFDKQDLTVPLALAGAMERDAGLRNDYQRMVSFYARLTNPRLPIAARPHRAGVADSSRLSRFLAIVHIARDRAFREAVPQWSDAGRGPDGHIHQGDPFGPGKPRADGQQRLV